MAFSVQNDQGSISDANSYITVAFYKSYHTDRGVAQVINVVNTDGEIQSALILATDYLDSRYKFIGEKRVVDQATEWPRFDAEDIDDNLVTGLPHQVEEACAELALSQLLSPGSLFPSVTQDPSGQGVKRTKKKLDVLELETEYFGSNATTALRSPVFYQADWRLKRSGLLDNASRLKLGG